MLSNFIGQCLSGPIPIRTVYAIAVPLLLLVLLGIGALEADCGFLARGTIFGSQSAMPVKAHQFSVVMNTRVVRRPPSIAARTADSRGALRYSTYCVGCHTTQVHWREKKLATDWTSLKAQVRRWQSNAGLGLSEDDIAAIAHHLNDVYHHFVATGTKVSGEADTLHRAMARR